MSYNVRNYTLNYFNGNFRIYCQLPHNNTWEIIPDSIAIQELNKWVYSLDFDTIATVEKIFSKNDSIHFSHTGSLPYDLLVHKVKYIMMQNLKK